MDTSLANPDALLERMTDAFLALDREWRIVYMNSAAMGLNKRPRPDVIGRLHWEEWPQTVGSEVERQYRLAMSTQRPVHFEHHYTGPDQDFWHSIHAYPDEHGLSIFYRDITQQKRTEELAKVLATAGGRFASAPDLKSTLRTVAEMALPLLGQWACVYLVDDSGKVSASRVAGIDVTRRDALRALVSRLPIAAVDERLPFVRAMQSGEPQLLTTVDDSFREALGDETLDEVFDALGPRSLLCLALVARGRTIGGITFGTSKGYRRHDERDVLAAREVAVPAALALDNARLFAAESRARKEAEIANQSKVDFLRAMSHEFRTPLNAIGGYTQLLLTGVRGELTAVQRRDIQRIERNYLHVTTLINDILSFTRLETGRVEFHFKRVAVKDLLGELEGYVGPDAGNDGKKRLTVRPTGTDVTVWADPAKTTQILVNLVTNALKHTPPETHVDVWSDGPRSTNRVRIHVRDNGPGIDPEKQRTIFEPFVQLGRSLNRPIDGLGLGLAVSRDLARKMHGDLSVTSTVGKGATFTLTLPIK